MPRRPTTISIDVEARRHAAKELFNYTWTLLEKADRTRDDDDEMVNAAHASRLFWGEFATPVHLARGEWQLSRVYATLERSEPALHHAQRCLDICDEHGLEGFDRAFAYEALARAHSVAGDTELAADSERRAREAAERISAQADRDLLLGDLATLPGH